jgi:hypothetical protein
MSLPRNLTSCCSRRGEGVNTAFSAGIAVQPSARLVQRYSPRPGASLPRPGRVRGLERGSAGMRIAAHPE